MNKKNSTYHVIIAGGVGERLWPLSSPKHPKQLLKIVNDKKIIEQFSDNVFIPEDVSNEVAGKLFNKILAFLSRSTKRDL